LFYPKDAERPQARDRREQKAKTLCAICPVLDLCKEHASANAEFGIWGGENEEERFLSGHAIPRYAGVNVARRIKRQKEKENV
jgi:WhiB family redox-sensing transcriptional regulator